jgi:DNA-binding MarR family transcriptional regulator|tara:strand:+ start:187 stop:531 length:345 start_codon:yes stop_codon:yes gene_type:complete
MTKLTDEVWEEFVYTVRENSHLMPLSKSELAQRFQVSINTITRWIDMYNLKEYVRDGRTGIHKSNKVDRNLEIYEEYWKHGKSMASLGKRFNMSRQRVHVIIKRTEQHRLNGQL